MTNNGTILDLDRIYDVSDADLLAAWFRDRDLIRPFDPELEADDASDALVGVGMTLEDFEALDRA